MNVAALVDTGSSINVISQTLYNTLSHKSKLSFEQFPSEIRLADNTKVKVFGLAKILLICNNEQHAIEVYILPFTSHPLILGTNYLHSNNIILDFSNFSANFKSVKVQTHKKLTIPPNSECIVWGHVPTYVLPGLNGVCSNHKFILEKGLMVAKSLVTVSYNHKVPVKVLNATALSVVIPKDRTIAEFLSLNSDYSYVPIDQSCPVVQNIDIVNSCVTPDLNDCSESCSNEHIEKVKDQFTLSDHLSESQQTELASLLYKNIDLFVTDDNPNLGYTKLIEHTIHLKPDASGHLISKDGILPPADRVQAIQEYPAPRNVKELRRLIGLFNWFKKFIPNFSATISSLTRLLQKNQTFKWGKEQDTAFNDLKYRLVNSEMLSFPQFNMQFRLSVDTSSRGIGYMLYQLDPEDKTCKPRIIRFGSKNLSRWQQSYGPTKLELLGMVVSILDCSDYLRGNQFIVECDHQALKPLYQKQFKGAIYERWLSILQQFNFEIVYKKAEQMEVPDALSRCENHHAEVVESPVEDDPYFPFVPDKIGHITLPNGQNFANLFQNNLEAVQAIHVSTEEHKSEHSDPYDADTDEPQYGNKQYKKKRQRILQESSKSDTDIVVDKMVNDKILAKISMPINNIKELQRQDTSLSPIINYLENDILPDLQKEARCVLLKSNDYALIDDILFHSRVAKSKRNKMMSHYQIVIPQALIPSVLKVVHDSPLGGHAGMNNTLDRAKEHFFFPRMGKIITDYVQTCHFCQVRKVTNFKTKQAIVAFPTPSEPFEVWQIDLCGPFPKSVNGNTYAFTAVDMFSKFIFAHPLRNNDALTVCEVIYRMFTQFGVCKTLVSDRGSEFVNQCTAGLCKLLEVTQEFTPAFAHHCLGACERQHRTLNERLTAHVLKDKLWETEINSVTFSMNSSVNSSIDFSPFEIVFGKRPKFPVFGAHFNLNDFHPNMQNYFSELTDRLKTVWEMVVKNAQYSGEKMEENANIKLNELKVSIGDYVYLQRTLTGQGRKFQPLYDGPFVVNSIPSPHLIKLRDPSGKRKLKSPVHINRVKLAHIRAPDPQNYLVQVPQQNPVSTSSDSNSESSEHEIPTEQDIQLQNDNPTPLRRTSRVVQKPIRYRDENFLSELSSCDGAKEKIKRILAKKPHGSSFLYLVQLIGEPAQNAKWKPLSELPPKAQELIIARPPPLV
ncbi:Hypothetical predicted protein [Mytilus galloprovincialis]|uniref:Integrase catalytic domain-containing protein n=1 Tax=Mytilus galloprovincialis TaxID=29158 RepID=A0A8B6DQE3_MYTGA|nr:Hypothetical predicted protein [Mytilus galloprovincialis]